MIATGTVTGSILDQHARDFILAAGLTNGTHIRAVNNLCKDLKRTGIWNKMVAIYPFVGGTASTHKWNLKNTSTYPLTFVGSPTHSSGGIKGDGATQYYDTGIVPSIAMSLNDISGFVYLRSTENGGSITYLDFGAFTSPNRFWFGTVGLNITRVNCNDTANNNISYTDIRGFNGISRTSSNSFYTITHANGINTVTSASNGILNVSIFGLGANGNLLSVRQHGFACFGAGLTSSQMLDLKIACSAFQTILGRNIFPGD